MFVVPGDHRGKAARLRLASDATTFTSVRHPEPAPRETDERVRLRVAVALALPLSLGLWGVSLVCAYPPDHELAVAAASIARLGGQAPYHKTDSKTAAQCCKRRCHEISNRRVPTGRETLKVF